MHASGSLIAQFLDASSNQRTDQWGGSVENRARFGLEVLKQLIAMFGRNVSLKVSPTGGYGDLGSAFRIPSLRSALMFCAFAACL